MTVRPVVFMRRMIPSPSLIRDPVTDFLTALALVFVIEGILYAIAPGAMADMARRAADQPPETLRRYGLIAASIGVAVVWLLRG